MKDGRSFASMNQKRRRSIRCTDNVTEPPIHTGTVASSYELDSLILFGKSFVIKGGPHHRALILV
jgi:hypothetical protein